MEGGRDGMHVFIYMNMYYKRVNVYIHTKYLYCASLNTINPSYIRIAYICNELGVCEGLGANITQQWTNTIREDII